MPCSRRTVFWSLDEGVVVPETDIAVPGESSCDVGYSIAEDIFFYSRVGFPEIDQLEKYLFIVWIFKRSSGGISAFSVLHGIHNR